MDHDGIWFLFSFEVYFPDEEVKQKMYATYQHIVFLIIDTSLRLELSPVKHLLIKPGTSPMEPGFLIHGSVA